MSGGPGGHVDRPVDHRAYAATVTARSPSCGRVSPGGRPSTAARPAGPAASVTRRQVAIDRPTGVASRSAAGHAAASRWRAGPGAAVRAAASRSDAGRSRCPDARHRDAGREAASRPDAVRPGGRRDDAGHARARCSAVARRGVGLGPRHPTPGPGHAAVRAGAGHPGAAPAGDARSAGRVRVRRAGSAPVGSRGRARSPG